MADVLTKAITANDVNNGATVVQVDKLGNIQRIIPQLNQNIDPSVIEALYTDRFDDLRYYTTGD